MLHFTSWLAAKIAYRLKVLGRENIPATGGALIVCNHVSYVDGILLWAASPRRIRFIIDADFVNRGFVGWFLRRIGAIPMPRGGLKAKVAALKAAVEVLKAGDLVGIFPEAYPTRSGTMLPFKRGYERLAEDSGVPVIPACIDRMWGSIFSYFGGTMYWKRSRRPRDPVRVAFGKHLPAESKAVDARQAVQELLAQCAINRAASIRPIHRTFIRRAARRPFAACLVDPEKAGNRLSYGKALAGAACLGGVLRPVLGDSRMVGVWLPSSTGGALANLALCLLGKTAVNLNYTAGPATIASAVNQCGITHVLTSKRFLSRVPCNPGEGVQLVYLEEFVPQIGRWTKLFHFLMVLLLPGWLLERALRTGGHNADDLATVVFSSGSTGEPKGIMLTHGNIAANVDAFCEHAEFSRFDRVLGVLPFFHSFGYTVTLWGPLSVGAAAMYLPDPRAAKEVGDACREQKCTLIASTATFLRFYLRKCGSDDFRSLRLLVCGAEKLPATLVDEFQAKFGVRALEGYGCTELSPVVSVNMADVEVNDLKQVRNKPGTVGHPLPGVACKTVHPETEEPQPAEAEGLLWITGPNVMRGYLHRDDLTKRVIRDGWYSTGDIARIDADGFITLTGRASRFAKIGGEMVPLERLEEELHAAMDTNDRVVAVTAVPDEKRGERILVLHLPLPEGHEPKKLCDALTARGLPNLWVPGPRDFVPVEQMPILGSGKLDLQRLKQLALELAK